MTVDEAIAVLTAVAASIPCTIPGSVAQLHRRALEAVDWDPDGDVAAAIDVLRAAGRIR